LTLLYSMFLLHLHNSVLFQVGGLGMMVILKKKNHFILKIQCYFYKIQVLILRPLPCYISGFK